jgi:hypothetical protein
LQRHARATRGLSAVLLLAGARCNLYEGRSLDLFPPAREVLVECREARDCERDRPYCAGGSCVRCLIDADCDRRHPACVGNACVECRSLDDCPVGQACNSVLNSCAPACSEQSSCADPQLARCSLELGVCVQCEADADCRDAKNALCGRGGRCAPCRDDGSCPADAGPPMPEPPKPEMIPPDDMPPAAPGTPMQNPMPAPAAP